MNRKKAGGLAIMLFGVLVALGGLGSHKYDVYKSRKAKEALAAATTQEARQTAQLDYDFYSSRIDPRAPALFVGLGCCWGGAILYRYDENRERNS